MDNDIRYERFDYNEFTDLNEITFKIVKYLKENNDDLFKLLKYNSSNALDETITDSDKSKLLPSPNLSNGHNSETRIFFDEFLDDTISEKQTQLRVFFRYMTPSNVKISDVFIGFQVICHNDIVDLDGYKNRKTVLMQQVINTLNGAIIAGIGAIGFTSRCDCRAGKINTKFSGIEFTMKQKVA